MNARPDREPGARATSGRPVDTLEAPHEPVVPAPSSWRLWLLLLGGPTVWFSHFMVVYLAVEAVCTPELVGSERPWSAATLDRFIVTATVMAVALCGLIVILSYRRYRAEPEQWLWWVALALGVGSAASVLAVGLPSLVVASC